MPRPARTGWSCASSRTETRRERGAREPAGRGAEAADRRRGRPRRAVAGPGRRRPPRVPEPGRRSGGVAAGGAGRRLGAGGAAHARVPAAAEGSAARSADSGAPQGERLTKTIGVDVGGTSVRAGVVDGYGTVLDTARAPTPTGEAALEE